MFGTRPLVKSIVVAMVLGSLAATPASATYQGDNGRLAFAIVISGNADIYSVLPNGHDLRRLTNSPAFDACPAYSRDGQQIAFCSNRSGASEIWTMNRKGEDQRQLTHLGGSAIFPDYSPDGTKVAFGGREPVTTSDEIYVVDAATGGNLTALTSCVGFGPGCFNEFPAWSPAGTQLVFIHADDRDVNGTPVNEQVWVMAADGSNKTQLTFDPVGHDQVPDWSPDGTKIAYEDGNFGSARIFVMNADGTDQHQLTFGPFNDIGPAWSPDGTQIAFVRDVGLPDRSVVVMNADGSDVHAVHPAGRQLVPAWQPLGGGDTNEP